MLLLKIFDQLQVVVNDGFTASTSNIDGQFTALDSDLDDRYPN